MAPGFFVAYADVSKLFGAARNFQSAARHRVKCLSKGLQMSDYTIDHARAGINATLPKLETWANHFKGYEITIRFPEYTSVCPKTGLPDYGAVTIRYQPNKFCLELKALKMYLLAYRNLGIFYENAVNRMLRDINSAIRPIWCEVTGEFTPRGGLTTTVAARSSHSTGSKRNR
jgi:7-cyano-7-deazaguanine reductase